MKIGLIGTGNTATVLGRKLISAGHVIVEVAGRSAIATTLLAEELHAKPIFQFDKLTGSADIYILAVSDNAISEVLDSIKHIEGILVHTAASHPKEVLSKKAQQYGVFYPLQSLHKDLQAIPEIPVIIDASNDNTLHQLKELAQSITKKVVHLDDEARLKLHLAAVVVNNIVNHIYVSVNDFCKKEKIDFQLLLPLIQETSQRLAYKLPEQLQTGPAMRHDDITIQKHLQILENHPEMLQIYNHFTELIYKRYPKKTD